MYGVPRRACSPSGHPLHPLVQYSDFSLLRWKWRKHCVVDDQAADREIIVEEILIYVKQNKSQRCSLVLTFNQTTK